MALELELPLKAEPLLTKRARYKDLFGGRGSAKSWSIAGALAVLTSASKPLLQKLKWQTRKPLRVLCTRELQNSIAESVHFLLATRIQELDLSHKFAINDKSIRGTNGAEFIFAGLKNNVTKLKSMEGVDICWVEEAEKVSKNSWEKLIPTIRGQGDELAEIWVSWNPDEEEDPTTNRFHPVGGMFQEYVKMYPEDIIAIQMNWTDNPWFPETLRKEKDYLYRVDPDAANHVWGGQFSKRSAAAIFGGKWREEPFRPVPTHESADYPVADAHSDWEGPYHGADWGFSQDPTTLVKCWVRKRNLYIEYESYEVGLELDETAERWREDVPEIEGYDIRADCSRPESISYVTRTGSLNVVASKKWDGCVEDGIKWLRSFEAIIIHPRCTHALFEAKFYKHKIDPLTNEVTSTIVDKHNHIWDAVRGAMEPAIRGRVRLWDVA